MGTTPDRNSGSNDSAQQDNSSHAPSSLRRLWQHVSRWMFVHFLSPSWMTLKWRHPVVGYSITLLLQAIALGVCVLMLHFFPDFRFPELLQLIVVALVGFVWGAGPSLVATLVGVLLVDFFLLRPYFSLSLHEISDLVGIALFICIGCIISLVARQIDLERRRAEMLAIFLAKEEAYLQAVIEAVPDQVRVYDRYGSIIRANRAARQQATKNQNDEQVDNAPYVYALRTLKDEPFPAEQLPSTRALRGETVVNVEMLSHPTVGENRYLLTNAAPFYDSQGTLEGCVVVAHDVSTLREANRKMDVFLGIASHELRTPMTSVLGYLEIGARLLQERASYQPTDSVKRDRLLDKLQTMLERAGQQMDLLRRLVNDLLDVSRAQQNTIQLNRQERELTAIIREAIEEQRLITPKRNILLNAHSEDMRMNIDADRMQQVMNNYLSNALKYSDTEEPVHVHVQREGNNMRVSVSDKGAGLTAIEQEHIWDRFYRVPRISTQSGLTTGLGLGLYICRTIIEQHDGQVGVQSVVGEGSTFWFILPIGRVTHEDNT